MTALTTTSPIAVIGAGTMGAGIVQVAATAGHDVYIYDTSQEAIERGLAQIEKFLARSVEKGKLEAGEKAAILGRIKKADTLQDLAPAKLVIEAIVENLSTVPTRGSATPRYLKHHCKNITIVQISFCE